MAIKSRKYRRQRVRPTCKKNGYKCNGYKCNGYKCNGYKKHSSRKTRLMKGG